MNQPGEQFPRGGEQNASTFRGVQRPTPFQRRGLVPAEETVVDLTDGAPVPAEVLPADEQLGWQEAGSPAEAVLVSVPAYGYEEDGGQTKYPEYRVPFDDLEADADDADETDAGASWVPQARPARAPRAASGRTGARTGSGAARTRRALQSATGTNGRGTIDRLKGRRGLAIGAATVALAATIGTVVAVESGGGTADQIAAVEVAPSWLHPDILTPLEPTIKKVVSSPDASVKVDVLSQDGKSSEIGVANPLQYQPDLVKMLQVAIVNFGGDPYVTFPNTEMPYGTSYGTFPTTITGFDALLPLVNQNRAAHHEDKLPTSGMLSGEGRYNAPGQQTDNNIAEQNTYPSVAAGGMLINELWLTYNGASWNSSTQTWGVYDAKTKSWSGVNQGKLFGPVPAAFQTYAFKTIASSLGIQGKELDTLVSYCEADMAAWSKDPSKAVEAQLADKGFRQELGNVKQAQAAYAAANGGNLNSDG